MSAKPNTATAASAPYTLGELLGPSATLTNLIDAAGVLKIDRATLGMYSVEGTIGCSEAFPQGADFYGTSDVSLFEALRDAVIFR